MTEKELRLKLNECNDEIAYLEKIDAKEELLHAYLLRASVLNALGHITAACSDYDECIELMEEMESSGFNVNTLLKARAYWRRADALNRRSGSGSIEDIIIVSNILKNYQIKDDDQLKEIVSMELGSIEYYINIADYDRAIDSANQCIEWTEKRKEGWILSLLSEAYAKKADAYLCLEDYDKSLDTIELSLKIDNKISKMGCSSSTISHLLIRADCKYYLKDIVACIRDYEKALALAEDIHETKTKESTVSDILNTLSMLYEENGDMVKLERCLLTKMKNDIL